MDYVFTFHDSHNKALNWKSNLSLKQVLGNEQYGSYTKVAFIFIFFIAVKILSFFPF